MTRRKANKVQLTWTELDAMNLLDERQRMTVDLCVALLHQASGGKDEPRLIMTDYVAGFTLYEVFGRKPGAVEQAATTHGNHVMDLADAIDELCR